MGREQQAQAQIEARKSDPHWNAELKTGGNLHLALGTAEPALDLITFYKKRGYVIRHVVLSKTLT